MFGVADYGAFVVSVLVFLMVPGPGNLALVASTTQGGLRAGLAAVLGIIVGDQVLLWMAVAGVAAMLASLPKVFQAVQWAGAAYLAYLGVRMMLKKPGAQALLTLRPSHYFQQALGITVLNPKAIVFYMAFFPLFVNPAKHEGWVTFGFMAITIAVLSAIYCVLVVLLTRFLAGRLKANSHVGLWLERAAGAVLLGFGIKLALGR